MREVYDESGMSAGFSVSDEVEKPKRNSIVSVHVKITAPSNDTMIAVANAWLAALDRPVTEDLVQRELFPLICGMIKLELVR